MSAGPTGMTENDLGDSASTMSMSMMEKLLVDRGVQQKLSLEKLNRSCVEQEERLDYLRAEVRDRQMRQETLEGKLLTEMKKRPQYIERKLYLDDKMKIVWEKKENVEDRHHRVNLELAAIRVKPAAFEMHSKLENVFKEICTAQDDARNRAKYVMGRLIERGPAKIRHMKIIRPLDDCTTEMQRLADALTSICQENQKLEEESNAKAEFAAAAAEEFEVNRSENEKKHKEIADLQSELVEVKNRAEDLEEKSKSNKNRLETQKKQIDVLKEAKNNADNVISAEESKREELAKEVEDVGRRETCLVEEESKRVKFSKEQLELTQKCLAEVSSSLERDQTVYASKHETLPKTLKSIEELNEKLRTSSAALVVLQDLIMKEMALKEKWNEMWEEENNQKTQLEDVESIIATSKEIADAAERELTDVADAHLKLKVQYRELLGQKEELERDIELCGLSKEAIADAEQPTSEGEEAKIVQLSRAADEWKKQAIATVEQARLGRDARVREWANENAVIQEELSKVLAEKDADIEKIQPQIDEAKARKDAEIAKISQELQILEEQINDLKDKNIALEVELEDDGDENDEELFLPDITLDHADYSQDDSSPIQFTQTGIRNSTPIVIPPREEASKFLRNVQGLSNQDEDKENKVTYSSRGRRIYKPSKLLSSVSDSDSGA